MQLEAICRRDLCWVVPCPCESLGILASPVSNFPMVIMTVCGAWDNGVVLLGRELGA